MEITSTEAQNNFGRYLKLAWFEDIIITKNGKKTVVVRRYEEPGKDVSVVAERAESYSWGQEKITYEDFLMLSESSENRYEYIDGEVYLLASPTYDHQCIIMEISNVLYNYFKGKKCRPLTSPFDVTLSVSDNKNVVQPDMIVICDTENINEKGRYTGVPTLVLEVLSDSTQKKDLLKKLSLYLQAGILEYWIVNPWRREVYLYCFAEQDIREYRVYQSNDTVKSLYFEGLSVPLEQLFS
ncbi:MAG: type II toxin-antitoxin system Phd/YefM family antitoxin [Dehalobacter sp. 4CP]|uniref:type II toxin-antitoxin system prevent-host-death family antitoxin n=1 Tax=Dehalobacter sp. CP TaxID=2594474 RepID=UPI0013C7D55D|nr:type II toxin-antitoxin system Phd/YefM family antitoxin [Dehalobacter sp.]NBJ16810.1 type II toxin-antitoxin system Phd/YefM family antitoxin [Dehalobacter sp. 4CP]